jgi:hypothetical protein
LVECEETTSGVTTLRDALEQPPEIGPVLIAHLEADLVDWLASALEPLFASSTRSCWT